MLRDERPGVAAVEEYGWLRAHKWLILRRLSQFVILVLFLLGPWAGIWIVKGSIASSLTLEVLPLTDPYVLLQSLLAGHLPEMTAFIGAAIVLGFYLLAGGRVYCSWVCPVNVVTDAAAWAQDRLKIKGTARFSRNARYWILVGTLVVAGVSGTVAWELVNPVSIVYRGLVFGMGLAWFVVLAAFVFDLFVSRRGWCGHLCPVGAFYSLLGTVGVVRLRADGRDQCNDCMDCFAVCPEPQVIPPALKGAPKGVGPVVLGPNCTNCGRCIDVCSKKVFRFATRFDNKMTNQFEHPREVLP